VAACGTAGGSDRSVRWLTWLLSGIFDVLTVLAPIMVPDLTRNQ
jgi:hypothetical protein